MKLVCTIILTLISLISLGQNLEDYFKIAIENNPGLKSEHKEFEAAMEKVNQVRALPDPNLSIGYFISPVETRVGPQRARFSLSQMFPWFGTLKAQGHIATLQAEAKYEEYLDTRNLLLFEVQQAYYPLYERDKQESIQKENLEILNAFKDLAMQKFESGTGSMVDVIRTEIMISEVESNIEILKEKEKPLLSIFNALLNRDASVGVETPDTLVADYQNHLISDTTFNNNPKIKSLNLKRKAMEKQEQLVYKQGLPKVGVGLDYMVVGKRDDMPGLEDNGKDAFMPMVSVSLPIFRSKYKSAKKEAQLMQEAYYQKQIEAKNSLSTAFESTAFELKKQKRLIELYQHQAEESERALELLLTSYANNDESYEELLKVQQDLLKYQNLVITTIKNFKIAESKLNYILSKNYDTTSSNN